MIVLRLPDMILTYYRTFHRYLLLVSGDGKAQIDLEYLISLFLGARKVWHRHF